MDKQRHSQNLLLHSRRAEAVKAQSVHFKSCVLNARALGELELLLNRAYYPLDGFMTRSDYESVLESMRLADNTLWPMPVCLDVEERLAEALVVDDKLALRDGEGFMLAVLNVKEVWRPDLKREAALVFGTDDPHEHPGVAAFLKDTAPWYVGGTLEGLTMPLHFDYQDLRRTPADTEASFSWRGWRRIAGFQTGELLHTRHKAALTHSAAMGGASILLHCVVDDSLTGGVEHFAKVRCAMHFAASFPKNRLDLGLLPMHVRKAGPRQALLETIVHRNYGCTHAIVEHCHADPYAGTGGRLFYPPGRAQELVAAHAPELDMTMLPLPSMAYVEEKAQYKPEPEITPDMTVKAIAPEEIRRRLEYGLDIPEWFTLPEVVEELRLAFPPRSSQGFTIFMTGLSGAGKSTLAKLLYVKFMELRSRPVTLLDGDIVRRHLSSELTFTREHRNLNIQRIGFVASEITKNRGIAICAPIAPYEASRRQARELISRHGGFIEIHMATPLAVCEGRDRKGLYAKARAGIIKGVTGVDDAYEIPTNPEIVLDTTSLTPAEGAQEVLLYLEKQGYIG